MSGLADSFNSPADSNIPTMTVDEFGSKFWLLPNGQFHREDGPAVEKADGTKYWFLNDKLITEAAFSQWREEQVKAAIDAFTNGLDEPLPVTHGKLKLRAPSR